ncbi:hypothetical protein OROGR_021161 [Orobanche gracilis]
MEKVLTLSEISNESIRNIGANATDWLVATKWQAEKNKKCIHMDFFKEYAKTMIELLKLHRFVPTLVFDENNTPVKTSLYVYHGKNWTCYISASGFFSNLEDALEEGG